MLYIKKNIGDAIIAFGAHQELIKKRTEAYIIEVVDINNEKDFETVFVSQSEKAFEEVWQEIIDALNVGKTFIDLTGRGIKQGDF